MEDENEPSSGDAHEVTPSGQRESGAEVAVEPAADISTAEKGPPSGVPHDTTPPDDMVGDGDQSPATLPATIDHGPPSGTPQDTTSPDELAASKAEAERVEAERQQAEADVARLAALPDKICPDCAETVKGAAQVCRFCSYRFDGVASRTTTDADPGRPDWAGSGCSACEGRGVFPGGSPCLLCGGKWTPAAEAATEKHSAENVEALKNWQLENGSGGTPEGWYDDPMGGGMLRWWDGSDWTGHTGQHGIVDGQPDVIEVASAPRAQQMVHVPQVVHSPQVIAPMAVVAAQKACGKCMGSIPQKATVCMHCGSPQGFWANYDARQQQKSCCGCSGCGCTLPTMGLISGAVMIGYLLLSGVV